MSQEFELKDFIQPTPEKPFYDPHLSYYENYDFGPFGAFNEGLKYQETDAPRYNLLGQKVNLPFGIPAGLLLNSRFVNAALDAGYDVVTYKTVRSKEAYPYSAPNILAVHPNADLGLGLANRGLVGDDHYSGNFSIANSIGVPSKDPEVWQEDVEKSVVHAKPGQLVIVSVQGTEQEGGDVQDFVEDFAYTTYLAFQTGAGAIELNLACPNLGRKNLVCQDNLLTWQIVTLARDEIGDDAKLLIKISYFQNKDQLKELLEMIGGMIDGVTAINSIPTRIYRTPQRLDPALSGKGRLFAGVSGPSIKWAGIEMVESLAEIREELGLKYEIFGTGGVTTRDDYFDYLVAGADCVMSAAGTMRNPRLAQNIKEYLRSSP